MWKEILKIYLQNDDDCSTVDIFFFIKKFKIVKVKR